MAAEVADLNEREAADALGALVETGLVRWREAGWAQFTHPLFRQAVYEDMAAPVREQWHAAAFRVLLAHGAQAAEAAEHAVSGHLLGDAQAITVLQRAGRAAMAAGAVATAHERLHAAVVLAGDSASPQLLMGLAETLLSTGAPGKAIEVYGRILESDTISDETRAHVHRMLGRALFVSGDAGAAEAQFEAATELGLTTADRKPALEALLDHATACWIVGGIARAVTYAARARELAHAADPDVRRRAESTWALVTFISGSPEGLPAAAAREVESDPLSDPVDATWSWGTLGTYMFMAKFAEAYEEADRVFAIASRAAEQLGAPMAIGLLESLHADTLTRKGRLNDALTHAQRATAMVELVPWLASYAWIANAAITLEMGITEEAAAWCDRIEKLPQSLILRLWLQRMKGIIESRNRRHREASDLFLGAEAIANQSGLLEPCVVPWSRDAIAAHVACGRLEDAARVVRWLETNGAHLPCRWPRATQLFGQAMLAEKAGDREAAETFYSQALDLYSEIGQPLSQIRTMIFFGRFLRQSGEARRARPYLARAVEVADECGAAWLGGLARDELHVAGGRQRRHSQPDELTSQEQRIAKLAADGLKVRQIAEHLSLSPRTVETHLQHVYQKLGVSSQLELMKVGAPVDNDS